MDKIQNGKQQRKITGAHSSCVENINQIHTPPTRVVRKKRKTHFRNDRSILNTHSINT